MAHRNGNPAIGGRGVPEHSHNINSNVPVAPNSPQHKNERPGYRVTLVPTPACADPVRALRQALKFAQRSCHLRCTSVEQVQP
jgi:hypothetical protein